MRIGMIGLGKMGANMVRRLIKSSHEFVVFDLNPENVKTLADEGANGASLMEELVQKLRKPRSVWIMVPAGNPTEQTVQNLANMMEPGDVTIDGGNSYYRDDIRRSEELRKKKLHYIDVGTSGGVWGLEEGYSIVVGGEETVVKRLRPIFETLAPAPDKGWGYVGPSGAGHFVKMIHNGIEYGLMQAYAEGFAAWVPDSGEGSWTLLEAVEQNCSIPVITMSLERRFRSREQAPFSDKLLAAMRQQFGGHAVKKEG